MKPSIYKDLSILIDCSKRLGLKHEDADQALELLNYNEFGLAFETIITQMYEYDIEIDTKFYTIIEAIALKMNLESKEYVFMKDLVRDNINIPKIVKDKLSEILENLKQL